MPSPRRCLLSFFCCSIFCNSAPVLAEATIYELAAERDTSRLETLLADDPGAWETGDEYLSDSPVGIAVDTANLAALKLFVAYGYDPDPMRWYDHPIRMINPDTGRDTPEHIQMLAWLLPQVEVTENRDYTLLLLDFAKSGNLEAATLLLDHGVNPNMWVYQWYSVWDLTEDAEMRSLLESYGGGSNFHKLIIGVLVAALLIGGLLVYLLKPKQKKALPREAPVPERNEKKGRLFMALGLTLFLLGSISMLLFRYGSVMGMSLGDLPIGIYAIFIAMAALGIRIMTQGKKLRTKDAETILEEGERPIFLYLRSFALDEQDAKQEITLPGGLSAPINPWETGLSAAFGKVGDMVGIGRPGEKLATTGAARLYVTDDEWQDKVLELVEKSDLVVWTYGATEGLRWEITRLVSSIPPEKLVLAMPFWNLKMSKREEIWEEARERFSAVFPKPLPDGVGNSLFVAFDENWTPSWVETVPPSLGVRIAMLGFWSQIARGVQSLLTLRGYNYPALTFGEKCAYGLLAAMGWVVVGVLLVMAYGLYVAFS
jgi:hypothetical protein